MMPGEGRGPPGPPGRGGMAPGDGRGPPTPGVAPGRGAGGRGGMAGMPDPPLGMNGLLPGRGGQSPGAGPRGPVGGPRSRPVPHSLPDGPARQDGVPPRRARGPRSQERRAWASALAPAPGLPGQPFRPARRVPAGAAGAAGFAAALAGAFLAGAAASAGKASLSLRTTGASMVDDADLTNSPSSVSLAMTVLLSTPSSLASSYTRTLATGLLSWPGFACRTVVTWTYSSRGAHRAFIASRPASVWTIRCACTCGYLLLLRRSRHELARHRCRADPAGARPEGTPSGARRGRGS